MKTRSLILTTLLAMTFFSCGNKQGSGDAQTDSLQTALAQREADYQELNEYISIISTSLDSISMQESDIFNRSKESPIPNREQLKQQLSNFQQTLKNQRVRIAELEKQLKAGNKANRNLQSIVASLRSQLVEKESQIADLRRELNDKNLTIDQLSERMTAMAFQAAEKQEIIDSQDKMIQDQDQEINKAYVIIATKSELKEAGLLTGGGLFKKAKLDYSNLDSKLFRTIDIRTETEITIDDKSPKLLTPVPEDTYSIEAKGDKSVLKIIDKDEFWKVSKYLIIQK